MFVYYRSEGSITNSYPDSTAAISFIPREMNESPSLVYMQPV